MNFLSAIIQDNKIARKMAESTISKPVLMSLAPPWVIALENVTHTQSSQAEVSELPVISTGMSVKQFQYDNVAPSPWSWQITGYIPGNPAIEQTNLFCPIVQMNTDFLRKAYELGSRVIFKDTDNRIYQNCVIQSLAIETKADARNRRPFTMTLKQIVEITALDSLVSSVASKATPTGGAVAMDTTITTSAGKLFSDLWKLLGFK